MYFLFVKIIDINYKEDIVLGLQSIGIHHASIFEAQNLESSLNDELNFFSGFFRSPDDIRNEQLIITALVEDKNKIKDLVRILKEAEVDIENKNILRLIVLPVDMLYDNKLGWIE